MATIMAIMARRRPYSTRRYSGPDMSKASELQRQADSVIWYHRIDLGEGADRGAEFEEQVDERQRG